MKDNRSNCKGKGIAMGERMLDRVLDVVSQVVSWASFVALFLVWGFIFTQWLS